MSEQGSKEWLLERCGKVTASRIADVVAKTKTGWGASRANYASQLLCERMTGVPQESYTNAAMQWGTEQEPNARNAYAFLKGIDVEQVGFIPHPKIAMSGASPDGYVNGDGLTEIKCPNTATHIETLLNGEPDGKYIKQMMWQMACTGRQWCDFVSFDPRMPVELQTKIIRINRDDKMIDELEQMVSEFITEINAKEKALRRLMQ